MIWAAIVLAAAVGFVANDAARGALTWYRGRKLWLRLHREITRPRTPEELELAEEYQKAFQQMAAMHNRLEILDPEIASAEDVFATWQSLRRAKTRLIELRKAT